MIPALGSVAVLVIFLIFFREPKKDPDPAGRAIAEPTPVA
jgi:hypothetical protein